MTFKHGTNAVENGAVFYANGPSPDIAVDLCPWPEFDPLMSNDIAIYRPANDGYSHFDVSIDPCLGLDNQGPGLRINRTRDMTVDPHHIPKTNFA